MPEQYIILTTPFDHSQNGLPTLMIGFLALFYFFLPWFNTKNSS
jgi:hypothetical protein